MFLGIYLVLLNLVPLALSIVITKKKEDVERYDLESTIVIDKEQFGRTRKDIYSQLNMLFTLVLISEVVKVLLYIFLALLFLMRVNEAPYKYLAFLSSVNMEYFLCSKK